ncbi:MAG: hypothetical protein ABEK50_14420, partial [bacterium]
MSKQDAPAVIPWAFRQIRKLYRSSPESYLSLLKRQAQRDEWIYQFFAAHELGTIYETFPEEVLAELRTLTGSDVEIVREGCATSWSKILSEDFEVGYEILRNLQQNGSYEERYTAAIAPVKFYKNDNNASQRE